MKKKQINLKQLALRKSKVASFESNNLTGGTAGYISWTGTFEPCFETELGCNVTLIGCPPPPTQQTCPPPPTQNCPPPTIVTCGFTQGPCQSDSICPQGLQCY